MELDTLRFAHIFTGRVDAYGTDTGGAAWKPVTIHTYERHLNGVEPIGIYPIIHHDDECWVRWGCCDIDTGDWSEAFMLATALTGMGFKPWVERSRSKGWHVWVFVSQWMPASVMRRALKVAYAAIDLPAKEANPKSEKLRPNQLGNYVRLPYKAAAIMPSERQVFTEGWNPSCDGQTVSVRDFLAIPDKELFTDMGKLQHWASKWYEPVRRSVNIVSDPDADVLWLADRLPADWRKVWLSGEVRDRSATFVAMAYAMAKRGWQPQEVFDLLWGCPWNKYRDRPNGEVYVQDIVERVFS